MRISTVNLPDFCGRVQVFYWVQQDCWSLLLLANSLEDLIIPLCFYLPGNYGLLFSCYMKKPFFKKKKKKNHSPGFDFFLLQI